MPNLFNYLPDITFIITAWLLLDLFGSGLFRLLVRPRARRNWEIAQLPEQAQNNTTDNQPEIWLNYLRHAGYDSGEKTAHLRLKMKGIVRSKAKGQWHPAECRAFFTLQPLSLVWYADITRAFMVSVKATEQYAQNHAFSTRWVLSTFPFRWAKGTGAQELVQRNAFYGLAGAVWQPQWWWHYTLEWGEIENDTLLLKCRHQEFAFCLKAKINAAQELAELSLWTENWQVWQTGLLFSDYREVEGQKMPFQVEVLRKDKNGAAFVQAELEVTDRVQKGKYAWW